MSTIKSDRVDFEKLLNGLDPVQQTPVQPVPQQIQQQQVQMNQQTAAAVDNASAAEMMSIKTFEYDYEATRKGLRKRARKTILGIVDHIIPADIMNEEYIQDKIEQDIELMTELYMQSENNKIMQRSIMDSVSRGNVTPRMYEVFAQLTDKMQSINKQISDMETKIRKTYIDLKFEIRDKRSEDSMGMNNNNNMIGMGNNQNTAQGVIVTSTKNLIGGAKRRHIDSMLDEAKDAKFEETK
jgi:hypothetical protein